VQLVATVRPGILSCLTGHETLLFVFLPLFNPDSSDSFSQARSRRPEPGGVQMFYDAAREASTKTNPACESERRGEKRGGHGSWANMDVLRTGENGPETSILV